MMFDYLIIGAGPAGLELALQARKRNLTVGLIEKDLVGGTCLHQGCIPTKSLRNESIFHSKKQFSSMIRAVKQKVDLLYSDTVSLLSSLGVTLIKGEGHFIDSHHIQVGNEIYEGQNLVFAGGSTPIVLNIAGIKTQGVYDSTSIFDLKKTPSKIAIIGGGYIGLEWASIFLKLGSEVTLFESQSEILLSVDEDVKRRLLTIFKKEKFTIYLGSPLDFISSDENGILVNAGTNSSIVEVVLVAVGRKPNIISLPNGVKTIGDASGGILLAHKASMEARAIFEPSLKEASIPSVIYTNPEIAMVGATEKSLKSKNLPYLSFKVPFRANSKSVIDEETDGFIKLIVSQDKSYLLGAAIIGHEAGEMLPILTLAIDEKITIEKLKKVVFAHPTRSEIIYSALESIK